MKTKVRERKMVVKGRLRAENENQSVEGLKVNVFAAGTKKLLASTVTGKDGKYDFEFKNGRLPDVEVLVTPNVDEKALKVVPPVKKVISKDELLEPVDIIISDVIWDIWGTVTKHYAIFGMVTKGIPDPDTPGSYLDLIPIPDVTVHIYDVSLPWIYPYPPPYIKKEIGTATTASNGTFIFEFDWSYSTWPHPYWLYPDTKPDILIEVTQRVDGEDVLIYAEDPDADTRWNIDELPPLGIPIIIEDEVVLPDETFTPISGDFEFHGIGRVLISQINSEGYANTTDAPVDVVKAVDSPFGSTIDVKGQFNNALAGKFYQVQVAKWQSDSVAPSNADFAPIVDEQWPVAQKVGSDWVTVMKKPVELPGAGEGCYEIPDYTDYTLTSKSILIRWNTDFGPNGAKRFPDGKYSLRVRVFNEDGSALTTQPTTIFDVRLDNTWPVALISDSIGIDGSTVPLCTETSTSDEICDSPEACGIVYMETGKSLKFTFKAYDEQNHFRRYDLTYRFKHGNQGNINFEKYVSGSGPDHGFTNELIDWDISSLEQCGYEVRLRVWDRTINGYRHIHHKDDFINIILLNIPSGS